MSRTYIKPSNDISGDHASIAHLFSAEIAPSSY